MEVEMEAEDTTALQDTQDDANGADIQSKSKRKSVNYLWDKKGSVKNMTNKFESGPAAANLLGNPSAAPIGGVAVMHTKINRFFGRRLSSVQQSRPLFPLAAPADEDPTHPLPTNQNDLSLATASSCTLPSTDYLSDSHTSIKMGSHGSLDRGLAPIEAYLPSFCQAGNISSAAELLLTPSRTSTASVASAASEDPSSTTSTTKPGSLFTRSTHKIAKMLGLTPPTQPPVPRTSITGSGSLPSPSSASLLQPAWSGVPEALGDLASSTPPRNTSSTSVPYHDSSSHTSIGDVLISEATASGMLSLQPAAEASSKAGDMQACPHEASPISVGDHLDQGHIADADRFSSPQQGLEYLSCSSGQVAAFRQGRGSLSVDCPPVQSDDADGEEDLLSCYSAQEQLSAPEGAASREGSPEVQSAFKALPPAQHQHSAAPPSPVALYQPAWEQQQLPEASLAVIASASSIATSPVVASPAAASPAGVASPAVRQSTSQAASPMASPVRPLTMEPFLTAEEEQDTEAASMPMSDAGLDVAMDEQMDCDGMEEDPVWDAELDAYPDNGVPVEEVHVAAAVGPAPSSFLPEVTAAAEDEEEREEEMVPEQAEAAASFESVLASTTSHSTPTSAQLDQPAESLSETVQLDTLEEPEVDAVLHSADLPAAQAAACWPEHLSVEDSAPPETPPSVGQLDAELCAFGEEAAEQQVEDGEVDGMDYEEEVSLPLQDQTPAPTGTEQPDSSTFPPPSAELASIASSPPHDAHPPAVVESEIVMPSAGNGFTSDEPSSPMEASVGVGDDRHLEQHSSLAQLPPLMVDAAVAEEVPGWDGSEEAAGEEPQLSEPVTVELAQVASIANDETSSAQAQLTVVDAPSVIQPQQVHESTDNTAGALAAVPVVVGDLSESSDAPPASAEPPAAAEESDTDMCADMDMDVELPQLPEEETTELATPGTVDTAVCASAPPPSYVLDDESLAALCSSIAALPLNELPHTDKVGASFATAQEVEGPLMHIGEADLNILDLQLDAQLPVLEQQQAIRKGELVLEVSQQQSLIEEQPLTAAAVEPEPQPAELECATGEVEAETGLQPEVEQVAGQNRAEGVQQLQQEQESEQQQQQDEQQLQPLVASFAEELQPEATYSSNQEQPYEAAVSTSEMEQLQPAVDEQQAPPQDQQLSPLIGEQAPLESGQQQLAVAKLQYSPAVEPVQPPPISQQLFCEHEQAQAATPPQEEAVQPAVGEETSSETEQAAVSELPEPSTAEDHQPDVEAGGDCDMMDMEDESPQVAVPDSVADQAPLCEATTLQLTTACDAAQALHVDIDAVGLSILTDAATQLQLEQQQPADDQPAVSESDLCEPAAVESAAFESAAAESSPAAWQPAAELAVVELATVESVAVDSPPMVMALSDALLLAPDDSPLNGAGAAGNYVAYGECFTSQPMAVAEGLDNGAQFAKQEATVYAMTANAMVRPEAASLTGPPASAVEAPLASPSKQQHEQLQAQLEVDIALLQHSSVQYDAYSLPADASGGVAETEGAYADLAAVDEAQACEGEEEPNDGMDVDEVMEEAAPQESASAAPSMPESQVIEPAVQCQGVVAAPAHKASEVSFRDPATAKQAAAAALIFTFPTVELPESPADAVALVDTRQSFEMVQPQALLFQLPTACLSPLQPASVAPSTPAQDMAVSPDTACLGVRSFNLSGLMDLDVAEEDLTLITFQNATALGARIAAASTPAAQQSHQHTSKSTTSGFRLQAISMSPLQASSSEQPYSSTEQSAFTQEAALGEFVSMGSSDQYDLPPLDTISSPVSSPVLTLKGNRRGSVSSSLAPQQQDGFLLASDDQAGLIRLETRDSIPLFVRDSFQITDGLEKQSLDDIAPYTRRRGHTASRADFRPLASILGPLGSTMEEAASPADDDDAMDESMPAPRPGPRARCAPVNMSMAVEAGSSNVFLNVAEDDDDLNSFDAFALPDLPDPEALSYPDATAVVSIPIPIATTALDSYGFQTAVPVERGRRSSQPSLPSPAAFANPDAGLFAASGPATPHTPAGGDGYGFTSSNAANFGGLTPGNNAPVSAVKPRRLSLGNHPVAYIRPTGSTAAAASSSAGMATPVAVPVSKPSYSHSKDLHNASLSSLKQSAHPPTVAGGGTTARKAVVSSGYGATTSSTPGSARFNLHKPSAIPGAAAATASVARPAAASGSLSSRGSMLPSLSSRTAGTYVPSFNATYTPTAAAPPANFNATYTPVASAPPPPNFSATYTPVAAPPPPNFSATYTPVAAPPPTTFTPHSPAAATATAAAKPTVTTPTLFGGSTISRVAVPGVQAGAVQAQHAQAPVPYNTQQFAPWGTPQTLMAANMPLGDESPFFGQSDMDTMDFAGEAHKVMMALHGNRMASITPPPMSAMAGLTGHLTPGRSMGRRTAGQSQSSSGAMETTPATPTTSILEMHVKMLTTKLVHAEGRATEAESQSEALRDQMQTMQFEKSMEGDADMERQAREYAEQQLNVSQQRQAHLEAEIKQERLVTAESSAAAASMAAELEHARQTIADQLAALDVAAFKAVSTTERFEALEFVVNELEAKLSEANSTLQSEKARGVELQLTLGAQALQLSQLGKARGDADTKCQRIMEQLIDAQTKEQLTASQVEAQLTSLRSQQQRLQYDGTRMARDAQAAMARATAAEAALEQANGNLAKGKHENSDLMKMCSDLIDQLEAKKGMV